MRNAVWVWLAAGALCACGGRSEEWDAPVRVPVQTEGLTGSVAVVDEGLDRLLMLTVPSGHELEATEIPLGRNVALAQPSPDRRHLFVLTFGVQSPKENEEPALTVVSGSTRPAVCKRYELDNRYSQLTVDPEGEWVALYDAEAFVDNANEIILAQLGDLSDCYRRSESRRRGTIVARTLASEGGSPVRLTFTPELLLPGGARRFLIVEREHDVDLLDLQGVLDESPHDEIRMSLLASASGVSGAPVEVVYYPGDPNVDDEYARIAVRLANDSSVQFLDFVASDNPDLDYEVTVNAAELGGVPDDIEFVHTDGGVRLAGLLGSQRSAVLVDPATSETRTLSLDGRYDHLSPITQELIRGGEAADEGDVALLWSANERSVAYWNLGEAIRAPHFSVTQYEIGISVGGVTDIPGTAFPQLKLLRSLSDSQFYVLDLAERSVHRMNSQASAPEISVAPDGRRAWVFKPGFEQIAVTNFEDLHPTELQVERDVAAVWDIARVGAGRAALIMHQYQDEGAGALGVTLFDAEEPSSTDTRFYGGLMLRGVR